MVHGMLVNVKLEVTGTSAVLNVFGSRQSSDVTQFIFCPNFCKTVTSILQLDFDEPFERNFDPRRGYYGILMLCMANVIMRLRCPRKHHFLVNHALGTMFNHFVF